MRADKDERRAAELDVPALAAELRRRLGQQHLVRRAGAGDRARPGVPRGAGAERRRGGALPERARGPAQRARRRPGGAGGPPGRREAAQLQHRAHGRDERAHGRRGRAHHHLQLLPQGRGAGPALRLPPGLQVRGEPGRARAGGPAARRPLRRAERGRAERAGQGDPPALAQVAAQPGQAGGPGAPGAPALALGLGGAEGPGPRLGPRARLAQRGAQPPRRGGGAARAAAGGGRAPRRGRPGGPLGLLRPDAGTRAPARRLAAHGGGVRPGARLRLGGRAGRGWGGAAGRGEGAPPRDEEDRELGRHPGGRVARARGAAGHLLQPRAALLRGGGGGGGGGVRPAGRRRAAAQAGPAAPARQRRAHQEEDARLHQGANSLDPSAARARGGIYQLYYFLSTFVYEVAKGD